MARDREAGKKDFLSEAEEILEELGADLQQLEASLKKNNVRPELINKLFREFHSLKGISGMLGFDRISTFTHELENMLDRLRLGKVELTAKTIDVLYQALDMLNRMLGEIIDESTEKCDPNVVIRKINEVLTLDVSQDQAVAFPELALDEQTLRSLTEYEEHRLHENIKRQKNLYSIRLVLDNSTFDQDLREITEILLNYGEIISTLPSFDIAAGADKMLFRLLFGTNESAEMLLQKLNREEIQIGDIRKRKEPEVLETVEEETEAEKGAEASLKSLSSTVRVDIQKLDEVINVIGELVITKAMILTISRELALTGGPSRLGAALSRAAVDLEKKLNDLQRSVIETRLVPIGQIYNKLARMVRKLSRETGKQIDLQFFGEDTELDKIMIEQLSDPLMHVIRNAIDHGIESKEERRRSGKPDNGLIKLSAFQRGNNVVLQVQDDGRGIQFKKVQEHARKRGLIAKDHVLENRECLDIIFQPGFSSSDEVTELSGRGVGLDVVKKNIADLKGSIQVFTEEDRGTLFEITLPITLAIIQALIVRINETKYAIPLSSVSETVRIFHREIQTVDHKEVYYLRDQVVPLIRVSDVFGLPPDGHREKLFVVIVKMADQSFGLVVDELAGQQEIVIKSMGEKLKNIPGIAGAAEIGEKKPILVIDAESMIEEVTQGRIRS